jgi:hypothetical protein
VNLNRAVLPRGRKETQIARSPLARSPAIHFQALNYRDLVEMMALRGLAVAHTTMLRWVQRFTPAFEKC